MCVRVRQNCKRNGGSFFTTNDKWYIVAACRERHHHIHAKKSTSWYHAMQCNAHKRPSPYERPLYGAFFISMLQSINYTLSIEKSKRGCVCDLVNTLCSSIIHIYATHSLKLTTTISACAQLGCFQCVPYLRKMSHFFTLYSFSPWKVIIFVCVVCHMSHVQNNLESLCQFSLTIDINAEK